MKDYIDPYGLNAPEKPIEDHVIRLYQADDLKLRRKALDPYTGQRCTPDNCHLDFSVINRRFQTRILFKADWNKGITPCDNGVVEILIPTSETNFRRGSLLYSLTWHNILRSERKVLDEGSFLIEYSADAPNPQVPYNAVNSLREEETYGF